MTFLSALGVGFVRGLADPPAVERTQRAKPPRFGARFTPATANRKLAPVKHVPHEYRPRPVPVGPFCSATSVSIEATCQDSCPFKHNGCLADAGFTRLQSVQMNSEARKSNGLEVAKAEAALIDAAFRRGVPQDGARGGRDLRLHVGGDAADAASAKALAGAARRWLDRGGGSVWTFTHAWRSIPRSAWAPISVLASVETAEQAQEAQARGYAAALVVADFPAGDRAFDIGRGVQAIPCPAETKGKTCVECRLCLDADLVSMDRAIAFKAHGYGAGKVVAALERVHQQQKGAGHGEAES